MTCKKCDSKNHVKAGFVDGEQRYKCKKCGCQFVPTKKQRGKPENTKILAIWLYLHGLSFRAIGKLLQVTHKSVLDWVRLFARKNYIKPEPQGKAVIVELDEMWHFLGSKKTRSGYGRLIAVIPINLSTGNVDGETMLHFQGSMTD